MKRKRLAALLLSLLLLVSSAQALTVEQLRALISEYYVDELPPKALTQATVEDTLEQLGDPYTTYFDAQAYQAFTASMQDTVIMGVGIVGATAEQGLLVQSVIPGGGAAQAGLLAGDVITAVDGKKAAGEPAETVSAWLRGAEHTTVQVTWLRADGTHTATLTRGMVVVPATTTELVDGHIGYIACNTFGSETLGHFTDGITQTDEAADHWVIDLRSNLGGDVGVAAQAAGYFLGDTTVAYLRDNMGQYGAYPGGGDRLTMDPVILLTSGHTASAAEIFSAAVRDNNGGLIIGSRTYGKGVAQTVLDKTNTPEYFPQGDALKITAYRYFSTNGASAHQIGVIPHLLVADEFAPGVARLLAGRGPKGNTQGLLRVDYGWRWYVDLQQAASQKDVFAALLEALPVGVPLLLGTGGPDSWETTTAAALAERYGLTLDRRGFSDVDDSLYRGAINALGRYGLMEGPGDGRFQPHQSMTRAELCVMLAKTLRCPTDGEQVFADVPQDAFYAGAVNALYRKGLVSGYGDGLFHPDEPIPHQQFITIMARLAELLSMRFYEATPPKELVGEALAPFAPWARPGVWRLHESQVDAFGQPLPLLWAPLAEIVPTAPTLREEAAEQLYRLLRATSILPE